MSRFYAPNSDFYSEIQELTQILLRISEEKIGGWGLWDDQSKTTQISLRYSKSDYNPTCQKRDLNPQYGARRDPFGSSAKAYSISHVGSLENAGF